MSKIYKGQNRYRTFYKAAQIIAAKISKEKGVIGILGTGAIGRKFGDYFSDLDMILYAHDRNIKNLEKLVSIGWISYKDIGYDIIIESYRKAKEAKSPSSYWNQLRRWDQQNSQILFDTGNKIKELLKEKLIYPDSEQKLLLSNYKNEIQEYLIYYPEIWFQRGQSYNIAESLIQAVRNIILWIYAKNRVFEPYISKWLFFHLENKTVPEGKYLRELTEIYLTPRKDKKSLMAIRQHLIELCLKINLKLDMYGFDEAMTKCKVNWEKVDKKSKNVLMW